ncbi:MAG: hypothetical protein Q9192_005480 [Flavoplaca navasiana]
MDEPYTTPTLTVEDEDALAQDRIIIQKSLGGKRKVSAALLTPPSSHAGSISSSSSSISSATASVRFHPLAAAENAFNLPDHAESVAAVEFCGFTPNAAQYIYGNYVKSRSVPQNPDDLMDYMFSQTNLAKNEMPPNEAMSRMGLTQSTQDRILDPRFEQIRGTESIKAWVKDTVRVNYLTLLQLQQRLKAAAIYTHKKKKRKSIQQPNIFEPEGVWQPSGTATATSNVPGISEYHSLPEAHITLVDARPNARPDHYQLFKGKAAVDIEDWIAPDGSIHLEGLRTFAGGDFNLREFAYYWTLEPATAEEYVKFARTRSPYSEIWFLSVQIKKTFVDSLRIEELWYGHDWKAFVWHCRKTKIPPASYDRLWKGDAAVELIKGHICRNTSHLITNIKAENVQTGITEANVMTINNDSKSTQWCFIGLELMARFDAEAKGKIHIEIRAPENSETTTDAPLDPTASKSS